MSNITVDIFLFSQFGANNSRWIVRDFINLNLSIGISVIDIRKVQKTTALRQIAASVQNLAHRIRRLRKAYTKCIGKMFQETV